MTEEVKEESNESQEETLPENAPTGDGNDASEEAQPSEESQPDDIETLKAQLSEKEEALSEANRVRDDYKRDLLALKNKERTKALTEEAPVSEVEAPAPAVQSTTEVTGDVQRDYSSKRADVLAEFEDKIQHLSEDEFKILQKNLKAQEQILVNDASEKNRYVARKHIHDMFNESLSYVGFKFKKNVEPADNEEVVVQPSGNIGSSKTNRKVMSSPSVSEESKAVAAASGLDPKRVEELKEKGYEI